MEQNQSMVLLEKDFQQIDGTYWMPIRTLARFLGYNEPRRLKSLYNRHKDELEQFTKGAVKMSTPGGMQETLALNELGCYTLAMFSTTPKAKEFRHQLALFLQKLRKKELDVVSKKEHDRVQHDMLMYEAKSKLLELHEIINKSKCLTKSKVILAAKMIRSGISDVAIRKILEIAQHDYNIMVMRLERLQQLRKMIPWVDYRVDPLLKKGLIDTSVTINQLED